MLLLKTPDIPQIQGLFPNFTRMLKLKDNSWFQRMVETLFINQSFEENHFFINTV